MQRIGDVATDSIQQYEKINKMKNKKVIDKRDNKEKTFVWLTSWILLTLVLTLYKWSVTKISANEDRELFKI